MFLDGTGGITDASAIRTASSDEQVRAAYAAWDAGWLHGMAGAGRPPRRIFVMAQFRVRDQ